MGGVTPNLRREPPERWNMEDYLEVGRKIDFLVTLKIKDIFLKQEDIIDYIKMRLNLRHCSSIEKLVILEDSNSPTVIPKRGFTNEKCHEARF